MVFSGYVFQPISMLNCCTTCISWEIIMNIRTFWNNNEHTHFCREITHFCREIRNIIFRKWWGGGGQRPFGTFPKIHPFWSGDASLSQRYHLRIAKTQGFTSRNSEAPPMMDREAPNDPKTFHRGKSHQPKVFWPFSGTYYLPMEVSKWPFSPCKKLFFWEKRSPALQGSLVMPKTPQNGWEIRKIHQDMEKR